MDRRNVEIYPYPGENELINPYIEPGEELWIINAKAGRKVVILPINSTEEEAWGYYENKWLKKDN